VTSFDLIPSFLVSGMGLGTVVAPLLNIILSGVPGRDAGSASGVLTTFQQLGGAVGVAVIGVIFFGVLSARSTDSVTPVAAQLQTQLTQLNVPASQAQAQASQFAVCFERRAKSSDPGAPVPGCSSGPAVGGGFSLSEHLAQKLNQIYSSAAQQALANDFVSTMQRVLFINAGLWLFTALVATFLPRPQRQPQPALAAAH